MMPGEILPSVHNFEDEPVMQITALFNAFTDYAKAGNSTASTRNVKRWEQSLPLGEETRMTVRYLEPQRAAHEITSPLSAPVISITVDSRHKDVVPFFYPEVVEVDTNWQQRRQNKWDVTFHVIPTENTSDSVQAYTIQKEVLLSAGDQDSPILIPFSTLVRPADQVDQIMTLYEMLETSQ